MRQTRKAVEQELRRRICAGIYALGSRLPLRRDLWNEFGASPLTLQRAMDHLVEQGFVCVRGSKGTFVAQRLPNRNCIGLIFPGVPGQLPANRFLSSLMHAAEGWDPGERVTFRPYVLSDSHLDVAEHRRLCLDLADGGLVGIFSVSSLHYLVGSPVLAADIPRVCIATSSPELIALYRSSFISIGDNDIEAEVMRRLHAAGRRRIAFITDTSPTDPPWLRSFRASGLESRPEWVIKLSVKAPEDARSVARLLCSGPPAQRPDCMLITDDNMLPHASSGILDAGLQVPREVLVAAHANFPHPTHAAFPCLRFGVDVMAILRAGAAEIVRLAGGGSPSIITIDKEIREPAR